MNTNSKHINPFDKISGSASLAKPKVILLLFAGIALIALILAKMEVAGAGLVFAIFFGAIYIYLLFKNPIIGFFTAIGYNFLVLGIGRYIKGIPLGFGIDGLMILTFIALIFF